MKDQHDPRVRELIEQAAEAEEHFSMDELEEYADQQRKKKAEREKEDQ